MGKVTELGILHDGVPAGLVVERIMLDPPIKVGVMQDKAWVDWIGEDHVKAEFMGDPCTWPVAGWPSWIVIEAVDMPLVLIRGTHGGDPMWVNASIIKRVWK